MDSNVIVVSNNVRTVQIVRGIVRHLRVTVLGASSDIQALELFKQNQVACVFVDGCLIKGEGTDRMENLVRQIRKLDPHVHLVAHSKSAESNRILCDAGCHEDVLKKSRDQRYHNSVTQAILHALDHAIPMSKRIS